MAETNESIILDIQFDTAGASQELSRINYQIATLKDMQKALKKEIDAGNDATGEMARQYAQAEREVKNLTATQKALTGQIHATTDADHQLGDSFRELDAQMRDLENQYKSLTKAQRESVEGQKMKQQLIELKQELKDFDAELGNHQRNVGNYPKAWGAAMPAMSKAQGVLSAMGTSMEEVQEKGMKAFSGLGASLKSFGKAFITPPIIVITAVLGAIALVVQKVSDAFKKNDDAMTALTKAFAIFEPIGDGVAKVFDLVALGLAKVAEGAAKVVQWIAGKVAPSYLAAAKAAQDLVQAQDDLEEAERNYTVESAKRNAEISKLKAQVLDTEKYTFEQRKKFLQDAIALEKQNLEERKNNAAEQVRILEETAKKESDTSDETKNKIAQARAAMFQAEQAYYDGTRKLQKQLSDFEAQERQARIDAWQEEWNKKRLLAEAELATWKQQIEDFNTKAKEALEQLREDEEENVPTPEEMARNMFGLDEEGVQYFLDLLDKGYNFANAKSLAFQDQTARSASSVSKALSGVSDVMQSLSNSFERLGEESDDMKKASQAFAWVALLTGQAEAIANTVVAITKAVSNAQQSAAATGPAAVFTAPAFIAEMVAITTAATASAIAGIAQGVQLVKQAQGYEHGGVIGGNSYTGDKVLIRANSGEGIYTGKQANTILQEIANNPLRSGTEAMTEAIIAALSAMPAPVMDYTEFRNFEQDVATYDELSKI